MINDNDMIGKVFGSWSVLSVGKNLYNRRAYNCQCKCGCLQLVNGNELRRGKSSMCRPCSKLNMHSYRGKHYKDFPEYAVYQSMKSRCYNSNTEKYHNHGGRGIAVCNRWRISFVAFMKDMGERPSSNHSIERINNDGNYQPSNCIWATPKVQANNRRSRTAKCYSYHKMKKKYIVTVRGKFVCYTNTEQEAKDKRDEYIQYNQIKIRIA